MLPFVERGPEYPTKPRGKMQESSIHDLPNQRGRDRSTWQGYSRRRGNSHETVNISMPEIQKGILSIATQSESVFQSCTIKLALLIAIKNPIASNSAAEYDICSYVGASPLSGPPYSLKASKVTVTDV